MSEKQKIAGPWQVKPHRRWRVCNNMSFVATVRADDDGAHVWTAGNERGIECGSDRCYINHDRAVKAVNESLVRQGYVLFEAIAEPDPVAERKEWVRAYKANESVFLMVIAGRDCAKERDERSAALQALRDLGVDVDSLISFSVG